MKNAIKLFFIITLLISNSVFCQSEITFKTKDNLPIINVTINGRSTRLLVDTGASVSVIDLSLKGYLNFDTYQYEDNLTVTGVDGNKDTHHTSNIITEVNGEELDIKFLSINIKKIRHAYGISGILGSDWLNKNKAIINFNKGIISINSL